MSDIIPNEAFPSDATIAQLDGVVDASTGLPYIAKGTGPTSVPSYEVQYNRRLQRQNRRLSIATEGLVVDEGSLKIGAYPCNYTLGGARKRFAGATNQSVDDDATRFVYVDSANALQIGATYPNDLSNHLPLAKVVTTAGAMTIHPETGFARLGEHIVTPKLNVAVGAESGDTIGITFSLQDLAGVALERRWLAEIWVADASFGDLASSAPSGGISISTGQQIGSDVVSDKHLRALSDGNGVLVVEVEHSGAATYHVVLASSGALETKSTVITFAA